MDSNNNLIYMLSSFRWHWEKLQFTSDIRNLSMCVRARQNEPTVLIAAPTPAALCAHSKSLARQGTQLIIGKTKHVVQNANLLSKKNTTEKAQIK
jgi:hypothetical protein